MIGQDQRGKVTVQPDPSQAAEFFSRVFRHAPSGGYYSFRSFPHVHGRPVERIKGVRFENTASGIAKLVEVAGQEIRRAAKHPVGIVLAPPIALFADANRAREVDLVCAPALAIDCDTRPEEGAQKIQGLLGTATLIVASGGVWKEGDKVQQKVHIIYRLREPAVDAAGFAKVKRANRLLAILHGSDPTAAPSSHPMRLPGSLHTKDKNDPRLCCIIGGSPEAEIDLDEALELLEDAARLAGLELDGSPHQSNPDVLADTDADLMALAEAIPNPLPQTDTDKVRDPPERWERWNHIGMAFWAASGGSPAGQAAFSAWSAKRRDIHDAQEVAARWKHYATSPPERLSVGTLIHQAREAYKQQARTFQLPSRQARSRLASEDPSGTVERCGLWPGTQYWNNGDDQGSTVELNSSAEIDLQDIHERSSEPPSGGGFGKAGDEGDRQVFSELVRQVTSGENLHGPLISLARRYLDTGMVTEQIVETLRGLLNAVPLDERTGDEPGRWQAWFDEIPRIVSFVHEKFRPSSEPSLGDTEQASEAGGRPIVRVISGLLHETVQQCEQAAAGSEVVYQRGAQLVRVSRRLDATSGHVRRTRGSLAISAFDTPSMRLCLNATVDFKRYDKRTKEWSSVDCPRDVAECLLSSAGEWPTIPPLLGVIEAPTLRPDGSLLEHPGYDPGTGLYLDPGGTSFPKVPQEPSKAGAEAALQVILDILRDFPFAGEPDKAVAVALIFTAVTRRCLRSAPMTLITAPTMGSGKSLLASVASYVATGKAPAMMSQAPDPESERKRVLAILMEGDALTLIDNVERPLASDTLCSVLTEPLFRDRKLGESRTITVPTCTTWVLTGNNATVMGDLTSRVLVCRIDPKVERPEQRNFGVDLHKVVPARRGKLVAAVLTIIRAYITAGSPEQDLPNFGRFEDWQQWCRYPLTWLGMADPCLTRASAENRDPVREKLKHLMAAWHDAFEQEEKTLAEVVKHAPEVLREAMQAIAGEKGEINMRSLGRFISKHEGRIEDGKRFEKGELARTGTRWRVTAASLASFTSYPQPLTRKCQRDSSVDQTEKNSPNSPNSQRASTEAPALPCIDAASDTWEYEV